MYNHLKNPDNYKTYQAKVTEIYYYSELDYKIQLNNINFKEFSDRDILMVVSFSTKEDVADFLGGNPAYSSEEYSFCLKVSKENSTILLDNGFFKDIIINDEIDVTVSDYIYMDNEFFFVSGVQYNGNVYLDSAQGLKNIVIM